MRSRSVMPDGRSFNQLINQLHRLPLRTLTRTIETDVCVVGAGLVGLAHAHAARRRGLSVIVLERDVRAVGESVRHGGHLFFSALPIGGALDTAELARERWLDLTRRAGAFADEAGTVIVARNADELAVMEAAAAERDQRAHILTRDQVSALLPIPSGDLVGGFHGARDLRVDPRRSQLRSHGCWREISRRASSGARRSPTWSRDWSAPASCGSGAGDRRLPGIRGLGLPAGLRARDAEPGLGRRQMLRVAAPTGRRYRPALATGLRLLRHPAFAAQPGAAELRARLELEHPELVERGVQALVTQLPGGDLIIGEARSFEKRYRTFCHGACLPPVAGAGPGTPGERIGGSAALARHRGRPGRDRAGRRLPRDSAAAGGTSRAVRQCAGHGGLSPEGVRGPQRASRRMAQALGTRAYRRLS